MIFTMSHNDRYTMKANSVYDQRKMVTTHDGEAYMVMRMQASADPMDGIEPLNQETDSIVFSDELPMAPIEYAPGKLFITGTPTHMYLVDDWRSDSVRVIIDNHPANTFKTQVHLLPGFNEETFPFIAVSGKKYLRVVNVKTL